ncbi:MAG TPA: MraY family glycosyltransferase [Candidatus Aquilonibacter sp.]|nr:MraY family glycosyltransferase [Candidatus Aquilonibacter sp.]
MMRAVFAAPIAFGITVGLVPLVSCFCQRNRIFDRPGRLKIHTRPVPRLGGIAIFIALLAGTLICCAKETSEARYFFAALALIWCVGLFDDIRGLPVILRLIAQVCAALLLWVGGCHLPGLPHPFASMAANCCLLVLFVNAFNWWDGMDGLAAGTACVAGFCYALLPSFTVRPLGFVVASSLAGSCAAFLLFNFRRSPKMFLGDSGSTALGLVIAFLGLDFSRTQSSAGVPTLFILAVAALPLLDALRVIAYRLARRRSPLEGDRQHFYDLMLRDGYGPHRIAITLWGITALCGGLAIFIQTHGRARSEVWLWALLALVALWLFAGAALFHKTSKDYGASELA